MKKVLLVYHALSSGEFKYAGMEKMLVWLGNSLADKEYDVTFCTLFDTERCVLYSPKVHSIELALPYYSSFFKRNIITFIGGLQRLQKVVSQGYDYVVNFGDTMFFLLIILKTYNNYKLITSERGDPYSNSNFLESLRRKMVKYSDYIVFQTNGARNFYGEVIKGKSCVIPNPVSIPVKEWVQNITERHIAFVARIDFWQKRPDILIKAFAKVNTVHSDYILDIYGSGDIEMLNELVLKLGLTERVIIHGAVENVNDKLLLSEIFVLTSDFEGIPNALLEAMAIGMPVISTDCSPGGAALLIQDAVNGILVKCGDVDAIAEGINYLIENKEKARLMGHRARISMSRFEPQQIILLWSNILK